MSEKRSRIWLGAVLAACVVCVLLRGMYAHGRGDRLESDARIYHRMAVQLLDDGYLGYSEAHLRSWRPPLYPTFLAGVYAVFGPSPLAARYVEAVVCGFVAFFMALLARRLGMPLVGLIAIYVYALSGAELRHTAKLYPENLASLFVVVFVWAGTFTPTLWRSLGRGVLAAGLIHLQPGFILLPLADAAWTAWTRRKERGWIPATALVVGLIAASTPWAIRNYGIHGRVFLVSTNGGFNLVKGYNDDADGGPISDQGRRTVAAVVKDAPSNEIEHDRYLRAHALEWMREHPSRTAWLILRRIRFWYLPSYFFLPGSWWPLTFGLIGPLAILGFVLGWRRRIEFGVLLRAIAMLSVPGVLVVYAGSRYRMPASPLIIILAAIPLSMLVLELRGRLRGVDEDATPEPDGADEQE